MLSNIDLSLKDATSFTPDTACSALCIDFPKLPKSGFQVHEIDLLYSIQYTHYK